MTQSDPGVATTPTPRPSVFIPATGGPTSTDPGIGTTPTARPDAFNPPPAGTPSVTPASPTSPTYAIVGSDGTVGGSGGTPLSRSILTYTVAAASGDTSGVTDTTNIHAARTAAGANGTLIFQAGTYWVTALDANVAGQRWIIPAGSTIKQAATNATLVTLDAANITIEGPGTLDGNGTVNTGSSNIGVFINSGGAGATVKNLTIQNTYQASIFGWNSPVTIQGNTILNTIVGPGIFFQPGVFAVLPDIHIFDNTIDKSSQAPATAQGYGIQLHGAPAAHTVTANTSNAADTTFTATTANGNATLTAVSSFTGIANGLALAGPGIPLGASIQSFNSGASTITMTVPATAAGTAVTITNKFSLTLTAVSSFTPLATGLTVSGTGIGLGATIVALNSAASTIITNLPASATGTGVTVSLNYPLRGAVVSRNKVLLPVNATNTMIGIEVWGFCPGAIVEGNRTYGGYMGISMDRADNGTVTANNVENYLANGIEMANCTNVTTSSNTCDASALGGDGVICDGLTVPTTKSTITGNTIVRAIAKAIFVITNGDHVAITGNAITCAAGLNCAGIYIQNSPSTAITGNMLYCFSAIANDAIVFEGSSSSGGVVSANVIEGWPRNAVTLYAGSTQTIDRIIVGPNVLNSNGGIFGKVGSAVIGNACRFVYAEQSQAGPNVTAITVTASPFTYTNSDANPEEIYITGGTVSAITKNAVTIFSASPAAIHMEPGDAITVTYSVAPTMNKDIG